MHASSKRAREENPCCGSSSSFINDSTSEDVEAVAHLLQRSKRKLPAPSFSLAPLVPLPLWQRVALSALKNAAYHESDSRQAKRKSQTLCKELSKYHADVHAREERQRRQQQEARARLGTKVAQLSDRYWMRRGDTFQQLMKVEFDVIKHHRDKRKQEDLLRETEELTMKLLDSIIKKGGSSGNSHASSPTDTEAAVAAAPMTAEMTEKHFMAQGGDGAVEIESSLSLLDTQQGQRPLRHYQRSALHWMVHLYENKLNGILADEMGLGKTVQTIALLCYYAEHRNDWGPHLIVVPTTVVLNWKAELQRWAPGLKVLTYIGSQKERSKLRAGWTREDAFHVCVTSYNLVVQDRSVFRRRPWGFLVLDEAHQVKNFMSKKWQSLFDLQAEYRLLLTGTPLQNSIMELWSLLHFLLPFASAFKSNEDFKEWFSNPMDDMITGKSSLNEDIVRRLQALIRPFMLRRLKKDVESQLPSKMEKVVMCRLSRRQRAMYDDYMHLAETRQRIKQGGAGGVLSVLLALRKVCNHPDMFQERPTISPLALDHLAQIEVAVPRAILLMDNEYRGRYRFPTCADIVDMNADTYHNEDACDANDACFSWLKCELLTPLFTTGRGGDLAGISERFSPIHFPAFTSRQWGTAVAAGTADKMASGEGGVFQDGLRSAQAALLQSFVSLGAQHESSRASTRCFQEQRYRQARHSIHHSYGAPILNHLITPMNQRVRYLCPSISQRLEAALPMIRQVALYVPAVQVVRPPRIRWALPIQHPDGFSPLDRAQCARLIGYVSKQQDAVIGVRERPRSVYDGSSFLSELWPVHVRRCFSFPNKRLLIHDCGKLQFLSTALEKLRQEGHRMLIFTQFVQMLNILERFLALIGMPYLRLDGSTRAEMRQIMVDRFNQDERIPCMILSTRSGGIGLNLTGADTVIFYDSDWNPTMDLQAQDRCHRIGQTKPVTIYRLISEHTVEESILQKARERKRLNNVVIRGGQFHAIAGVTDSHDDSAAAFAALSDPVNLRSFFHDLDEDATVGESAASLSSGDVLAEMGRLEDAEDRDAQAQVEVELREREEAEAADHQDDEGTGAAASDPTSPGAQVTLLRSAVSLPFDEEGGESHILDEKVRLAVRKRRRDILQQSRCDLDRLLSARYGVCKEEEAMRRYEKLCDGYERTMEEDADQLPPFRNRLPL